VQNKPADLLLIAVAFLLVFVALFLLRGADDNTLFNWSWAFARIDTSRIYLGLVAGLIISFSLSRTAIPDNYQIPFLAVLSFVVSMPFWKESEIIVDASRYFTQAKHLEVYGIGYFLEEWGRTILAWTDMPLVPFLYGMIFKLFGENRTFIQLFTTVLFSLTVVLTSLIGKTLWNRETGFSAGLLLLGIPYLLAQVPLMLVDVPTMFFLTLAIYTFLDALNKGGAARIICSVVTIVLTMLSKYSVWFMLSVLIVVLIVYAMVRAGSKDRRPLLRGAVILLMAAAVLGAILLIKFDVFSEQVILLREYQKPGLERWGESFHSTFLFQMHPLITLSALVSLAVALRKRDASYAIISWLVLLIVLVGIRRIRYALPVFPMLTLMAGYGLQVIKRDELRRFILFSTVTTSLVIGIFAYLPLAERMSAANLQHAGEYLNTLDAAEIEVITLFSKEPVANPAIAVPLLDLFTNKQIQYHYRPEGFPPREEIEQSSLRFTWAYRNPAYYIAKPDAILNVPVVVISDASNDPLPKPVAQRLEGYRLSAAFNTSEKIFRYNVGVRIYQKTSPFPAPKTRE
jgi:4-amino-4-deoxy-L-arabinose transferase-like glycosyltransferase